MIVSSRTRLSEGPQGNDANDEYRGPCPYIMGNISGPRHIFPVYEHYVKDGENTNAYSESSKPA